MQIYLDIGSSPFYDTLITARLPTVLYYLTVPYTLIFCTDTALNCTVSVLGQEEGYTVKYLTLYPESSPNTDSISF